MNRAYSRKYLKGKNLTCYTETSHVTIIGSFSKLLDSIAVQEVMIYIRTLRLVEIQIKSDDPEESRNE